MDKLKAINMILLTGGDYKINTLDTSLGELPVAAEQALDLLENTKRTYIEQSFYVCRTYSTFNPDANGEIKFNKEVLMFRLGKEYVIRNNSVYNMIKNTYKINKPITGYVCYNEDFESLDPVLAGAILTKAILDRNIHLYGENSVRQDIRKEFEEADKNLKAHDYVIMNQLRNAGIRI